MKQTMKKQKSAASLTFQAWVTRWLQQKKPYVKYSTYATYTNTVVNHLLPYWGKFRLSDITAEDIRQFSLRLMGRGRLDGTGVLALSSVNGIIIVLRNILHDAARLNGISLPPLDLRIPTHVQDTTIQPVRRQILTDDTRNRLFDAIRKDVTPASVGFALALHTGLRIGEICALRWADIDLDHALLAVRQTIQRVYIRTSRAHGSSQLVFGTPKTRTSYREVPLSHTLVTLLRQLPVPVDSTNAFLLTGTSKCMEVRTYRRIFQRFLQRHQMEHIHFHALRHTFATRCIECGADPKTVSELLGHATIAMTLNLYVHPQLQQKRDCVERITE